MSKIWFCSECWFNAEDNYEDLHQERECRHNGVTPTCKGTLKPFLPVSAVIEMIDKSTQPKFHDDSDKLREFKNRFNQELESLKKQIEGK
jgi:hypothetical protein